MRDGSRTGSSTAPLNAESATGIRDDTSTPFPSGLTAPEFVLRRSRYVCGRPSGEFAGCRLRARYRSEWLALVLIVWPGSEQVVDPRVVSEQLDLDAVRPMRLGTGHHVRVEQRYVPVDELGDVGGNAIVGGLWHFAVCVEQDDRAWLGVAVNGDNT